jgi:hypothetical protein
MTVSNGALSLAQAVRVVDLRAYLISKGWKPRPLKRREVILFEGPLADNGKPLELLVPASERLRDYPLRLEEILNALSVLEDRPVAEIIHNVVTPTSDVLHFSVDSPDTRTGTLGVPSVQRFFSGLRDLLVFAACGQLEPKAKRMVERHYSASGMSFVTWWRDRVGFEAAR